MAHLSWCSRGTPGNRAADIGEVIKTHSLPGTVCSQAPGRLTCLDLGRAQNSGPALDSALKRTLEPEQCRPGKHTPL